MLNSEEVLFCHWNRHLPLPDVDWIESILQTDSEVLHRAAALTTLREPGDVLMIVGVDDEHPGTWGLRWNRGQHPSRDEPSAEVRWVQSESPLDWRDLLVWTDAVASEGRCAEVLVVDGEFDVTAYRLNIADLQGASRKPSELTAADLGSLQSAWRQRTASGEGNWLPLVAQDSPLPQIGVPQASGVWLNAIESEWLEARLQREGIESPVTELYDELLERGLWPRPGFKYGCRWRIYSADVGAQHAPWLLVPLDEAPVDWNQACLSARLAAGVNKSWICAIEQDIGFGFLEMHRWSPGKA